MERNRFPVETTAVAVAWGGGDDKEYAQVTKIYSNPTSNSARDLRALDEQRDMVSKKAWGGKTLPGGGGEVVPNAGAGEPPTGLGNDQAGGGDGGGGFGSRETREGRGEKLEEGTY